MGPAAKTAIWLVWPAIWLVWCPAAGALPALSHGMNRIKSGPVAVKTGRQNKT